MVRGDMGKWNSRQMELLRGSEIYLKAIMAFVTYLDVHLVQEVVMPKYLDLEDMGSPMAKLFGVRLRRQRLKLGLSQGDLFEATRVTASYISYVERGKGNPSLDVMIQLADAVGLQIHEMLAPPTEEDESILV